MVKAAVWLGVASVLLALLVGIHQYLLTGRFFEPKDALHHEFLMALLGGYGLGVLTVSLARKPPRWRSRLAGG